MNKTREPQAATSAHVRDHRAMRFALVLAGLSALLAAGFFSLSRAVVRGRTADFDRQILLAMREPGNVSDPIGPRWVEEMARDVTALGSVVVLTLVVGSVSAFFWLASMRRGAVYVALACIGAMVISTSFKRAFERPRPELAPHGAYVYTSSFPSGHSTMSAAVYLTLGIVAARFVPRRRLKTLFLGVAVLVTCAVGVSRVYMGVHWPSDVVAGWAVGASWALICWCVAVWLQERGVIERDAKGVTTATP